VRRSKAGRSRPRSIQFIYYYKRHGAYILWRVSDIGCTRVRVNGVGLIMAYRGKHWAANTRVCISTDKQNRKRKEKKMKEKKKFNFTKRGNDLNQRFTRKVAISVHL